MGDFQLCHLAGNYWWFPSWSLIFLTDHRPGHASIVRGPKTAHIFTTNSLRHVIWNMSYTYNILLYVTSTNVGCCFPVPAKQYKIPSNAKEVIFDMNISTDYIIVHDIYCVCQHICYRRGCFMLELLKAYIHFDRKISTCKNILVLGISCKHNLLKQE